MTQLGESVAPPGVDFDEVGCLFDHETPEPPSVDNDVIGNGTTLRSRMKAGASTGKYRYADKQAKILNPKDVASSNIAKGKKPILVAGVASGYPLSCAAHHLVPGQESLKRSSLLKYMVKKNSPEKIKGGSFDKGGMWCDVGYDVNGTQNGVYLPGSYAVGGGRGGMNVWTQEGKDPGIASMMAGASGGWADTEDEDEDDAEPGDAPDPNSNALSGMLYQISKSNRKWQYVKGAVSTAPGQFHDRHEPYSNFVLTVLEKISENYKLAEIAVRKKECEECNKRGDKLKELGLPTNFGLIGRLNGCSKRMSAFLNGSTWRRNIYTSGWGLAFMEAVARGSADAD